MMSRSRDGFAAGKAGERGGSRYTKGTDKLSSGVTARLAHDLTVLQRSRSYNLKAGGASLLEASGVLLPWIRSIVMPFVRIGALAVLAAPAARILSD